jgi:hypothetical protein
LWCRKKIRNPIQCCKKNQCCKKIKNPF